MVDMEQYVLVLRQCDPGKSRILITESTKINPQTAEVVSGRNKKKAEITTKHTGYSIYKLSPFRPKNKKANFFLARN